MPLVKLEPKLFLVEPHDCCDSAEMYLCPPHKKGTIIDGPGMIAKVAAVAYWYLDLGDGGPALYISFCPWCGIELEQIPDPADIEYIKGL